MKGTKSKFIWAHIIVFLLFILIIGISFIFKNNEMSFTTIGFMIFSYIIVSILAGFPSVIRKIIKKKTYFFRTSLYGLILFLYLLLLFYIINEVKLFRLDQNFLDLIYSIEFIIIVISIPIHASIYHKVGFFYLKLLKIIIEKIFKIKILKEGEYKVVKPVKEKLEQKKEKVKRKESKLTKAILKITKPIADLTGLHKKKIVFTTVIVFVLILVSFVSIFGLNVYMKKFFAVIESITPQGETPVQSVIKIIYSSDIKFKNPENPGEVLKITPRISGAYKIEGRTLFFIPDRELPLSTKYDVTVNTSLLKAIKKRGVKGKKFSFHTKLMSVEEVSFYFNIDQVTKKAVEFIGEIEFSLPIDFETLKERVEVKIDRKKIVYDSIEPSERSNVFYIKMKGIEQANYNRKIEIILKKGIMPLGGTLPLEKEFVKTLILKEKERLYVEKLETHPVVGNTFISIKFNMPVKEEEISKHISIDPEINYKISAEYRYIVLEANFEPNISYTVKINKELKAKDNTDMKEDYSDTITIRDMDPYVKFTSEGKILPMTDNLNVEFVSLNLDEINFSVEKIYKNNLINYLLKSYDYGYGQNANHLYTKRLKIEEGNINEEVKNLINLRRLFNSKYQGLYNLKISDPKGYQNYTSMTVNITNMGLVVKNDNNNLYVYAVNILTLTPMANISISLISRENQILQKGVTDREGKIIFYNYRLTQERLNPYLIFAEKKEDFTFLLLNRNRLDYSTFDISGRTYNSRLHEAFVATERGVYRPGEDVYTSIILRKANLDNPDNIPLKVVTTDTTGKEVFNKVIKIGNEGVESVKIPTKYQFKTGEYYINVYQEDSKRSTRIGSTNFKVEEFIPYNIEVKLELIEKTDNKIIFKVKSNELHGAPSRGLKVNCDVIFKSMRFTHKDYTDYNFYNNFNKDFYQVTSNLGESVLDDKGEKIYEIEIPKSIQPPSAIRAIIYVEVFDSTGRPVSDALGLDMHKYSTYFGVKIEGTKPYTINKEIKVKYVAINPKGKQVNEDDVDIWLERKVWYSIFKKFSWTDKYSSETYHEVIYRKKISLNGKGEYSFIPDKGGNYTVTISKKNGMTTTTSFHVYDSKMKDYRDMSEPYKLILNLDKKDYNIGDTAYLTIIAPFEGMAILSHERETVYKTQYINLSSGKAVVPIAVTKEFLPNMYISVMAYRRPSYKHMSLPPVSYGAVNISMDKNRLSQDIEITCPKKTRSSDGLKVDLYLPGAPKAKVIIACVDEGILQITNYQRPDPYDFFYRKRRLSVRTNTTLKDLLPDIAPYKKAFGGGFEGDLERRHLNPIEAKRVKSLSLYSGVLESDASGRVSHIFKMHQFNGKVRVMVMSAKNKKFGSTQANVTITDPIVITPGIPRILAPKDVAKIPVKVFNKTGKKGNFKIRINTDGPLQVESKKEFTLSINSEGEQKTYFTVKGKDDAGIAHIIFNAEGNGEKTFHETELAVRPAAPLETKTFQGVVLGGREAKITLDEKYITQGSYKNLIISSNKLVRCLSALEYLVKYPYGCTEQVVSTAFPLLYLKDLSVNLSVFNKNSTLIDKYIGIAIKKVERRILNNGEFAFWDGGRYGYPWISDYASHFIIEAKRFGYPISDEVYAKITERIGLKEIKIKRGRLDRREDNIDMELNRSPYRLYLKALIGVPDFDNMKYYYDMLNDKKKEKELSETDRCFMAAAYALADDKEKANQFLPENFAIKTFIRTHSGKFNSYVRNTALYLFAIQLIDPEHKKIDYLEEEIFKNITKDGHFGNSHDTAWALLALSHIKGVRKEQINAQFYAGEQLVEQLNKEKVYSLNQLTNNEYIIKNSGKKKIYYSYTSFGYPLFPDTKKVTNGLDVNKEFRDTKGNPIDIKNIKQGDQLIVTLTVKNETKEDLENLILLDLLPAGLEIENLRLASRGDFSSIPKNLIDIDYEDIRDDRIIIAARKLSDNIRYSYLVRAISPGEYVIPQFMAEAMYDPSKHGKSESKEGLVIKDSE